MPLWIGDYLADTMHLTGAEHGAYLLLLMHSWRNGPLPKDDASLAAIARTDPQAWRRIAAKIRPFFTEVDSGLIQKRLEQERAKAFDNARQRSEKAAKAATSRWQKQRPGDASSITGAMPDECPSPSPSPSPSGRHSPSSSSEEEGVSPAGADEPPEADQEKAADPPPAKVKREPPEIPSALLNEMAAAWNSMARIHGMPQVSEVTTKRAAALRARIKERWSRDPMGMWTRYLEAIAASPFLRGENDRGWKANIDWAIRPDSPVKVAEGRYSNDEGDA